MNTPTNITQQHTCRTCRNYLPSDKAGQRAWMDGYGYCNAPGAVREERCMFFQCDRACWIKAQSYQKRIEVAQ